MLHTGLSETDPDIPDHFFGLDSHSLPTVDLLSGTKQAKTYSFECEPRMARGKPKHTEPVLSVKPACAVGDGVAVEARTGTELPA